MGTLIPAELILCDVIARLQAILGPAPVLPDARFREDLGADSLDVVSLLIEVEDRYGLRVRDEEAAELATVQDASAFIHAHQGRDGGWTKMLPE